MYNIPVAGFVQHPRDLLNPLAIKIRQVICAGFTDISTFGEMIKQKYLMCVARRFDQFKTNST